MSTLTMTRKEREAFLADLHVGIISIVEEDGRTLTAPIWYDYEPGGELWVVTDSSSRKGRAIAHSGRFSLCAQTEQAPYKYVSVEGAVASTEPSDVETHTRPMAHRYLGQEFGDAYITATSGEEERGDSVVIRMRPERWLTTDYAKEFSPA
jgi:PPOX class probable F420-dependent enzyme